MDNTQSFYYQDLRKDDNGNWISEDSNLGLPDRDVYEACETACKTRKQIIDTQASGSYNVSQTRTNTTSYEFYYKTCTNNVCPLGAGEEIVKGCQCINDFAEAASIMQMLRQAGKDIICSDGTQKPM